MYDLHSHCLPGLDDGAKNVEMSLEMLRSAKAQGVNTVCATPHCITDVDEGIVTFLEKRSKAFSKLDEYLKTDESLPKLVVGAEVYLGCDMSDFEHLPLLCYGDTNYILLEMPSGFEPSELAEWIYNISIKGLRPVIAHIDRCPDYEEIMEALEGTDVIFQINASQFLTMSGRFLLKKIFKKNCRFFVSSDMHNTSSRACNIGKAREICDKKFPRLSNELFSETAANILLNKTFD